MKYSIDKIVIIQCPAYNIAPYIRDCLDGFIMQQTTFPFYAVVYDDASTDGTTDIIREYAERYPELIHPIYGIENQGGKYGVERVMELMREASKEATYVAYCDGDDYWTDPLKLQKEVDYLEAHPECGLVHTLNQLAFHETISNDIARKTIEKNTPEALLLSNQITAMTVVMRKDVLDKAVVEYVHQHWRIPDYSLWLAAAMYGRVDLLMNVTGVYRVLGESDSHSKNKQKAYNWMREVLDIKLYFYDRYNERGMLTDTNYPLQFAEMVFHARKRMLLDYKWIARKQLLPLLCTPLKVWRYMIRKKIRK